MASVKKILKRTSGGLKMAAYFAPFVLFVGGLLGGAGTGIVYAVKSAPGEVPKGYENSSVYLKEYVKDTEILKEKLDSGEITQQEYVDNLKFMAESDYIKEVLSRDVRGNEKWQEMLKVNNALGTAALSCLGGALLGGILSLVWVKTDVGDEIWHSAQDDLNWKPPKKKKNKEKETNKIESVVQEEEKIKVDISSDEEKLGSLDEYLGTLQG